MNKSVFAICAVFMLLLTAVPVSYALGNNAPVTSENVSDTGTVLEKNSLAQIYITETGPLDEGTPAPYDGEVTIRTISDNGTYSVKAIKKNSSPEVELYFYCETENVSVISGDMTAEIAYGSTSLEVEFDYSGVDEETGKGYLTATAETEISTAKQITSMVTTVNDTWLCTFTIPVLFMLKDGPTLNPIFVSLGNDGYKDVGPVHGSIIFCSLAGKPSNAVDVVRTDGSKHPLGTPDVAEPYQIGKVNDEIYIYSLDADFYVVMNGYSGTFKFDTDCSYMFAGLERIEDIAKTEEVDLDMSEVENFSYMFNNFGWNYSSKDRHATVDLIQTPSATNMSHMFDQFGTPDLDVRHFDTRNVTDMSYMFNRSTCRTINIAGPNFVGTNVTNTTSIFDQNKTNLERIFATEEFHFDSSIVVRHTNMFNNATKLEGSNGTKWSYEHIADLNMARVDLPDQAGYFSLSWNATIDANGGEFSDGTTSKTFNSDEITLSDSPEREFYTLISWTTNPDGTGTEYDIGDELKLSGDITLYANWLMNDVDTLTLDANGGSFPDSASTKTVLTQTGVFNITSYNTEEGAPVRNGKFFAGWALTSSAATPYYTWNDNLIPSNESDLTLYAVWSDDPISALIDGTNIRGIFASYDIDNYHGHLRTTVLTITTAKKMTQDGIDVNTLRYLGTISERGFVTKVYLKDSSNDMYVVLHNEGLDDDGGILKFNANSSHMFEDFKTLKSIVISGGITIDTMDVTDMSYMFYNLNIWDGTAPPSAETNININNLLATFNTAKVTDMSYMFNRTRVYSIDVSNFSNASLLDMQQMFYMSYAQIIDISGWQTKANITNSNYAFSNLNQGTVTIYAQDTLDLSGTVPKGLNDLPFEGSSSIVGGNGTTYDNGKRSSAYAHVDGIDDKAGYFTSINDKP